MDKILASAPGKLMLLGEHAVVYGYPCMVTAVDQRMEVMVGKNGKNTFRLQAPDLGLSAYSKTIADLGKKELPKEVQFVEILYKRFLDEYPQKEGIDVTTRSEFSSKFGFGSSSAVTVAFAKALTELYGQHLSKKKLFDLCYQTVLEVQGVGSGFDIASAIWGGTIYYVPPAKVVRAMKMGGEWIVVGYTGIKADTPTLVRMVEQLKERNEVAVGMVFGEIGKLVDKAEAAIKRGDGVKLGKLMEINHKLLQSLNVSGIELERLIRAAKKNGAYGAKLSGAGGGDCMLAVVSEQLRKKVEKAIERAGGEVMRVKLNAEGVRVEE